MMDYGSIVTANINRQIITIKFISYFFFQNQTEP